MSYQSNVLLDSIQLKDPQSARSAQLVTCVLRHLFRQSNARSANTAPKAQPNAHHAQQVSHVINQMN
jgi:hypothetical protein